MLFYIEECKYLIIGEEVGANGTPHLQGYFILERKQRMTALKNKYPHCFEGTHMEVARGTPDQNRTYCTKQDKDGYFVMGEIPDTKTSMAERRIQIINKLLEGESSREILEDEQLGGTYATQHKIIEKAVDEERDKQRREILRPTFEGAVLRPWQTDLLKTVEGPASPRTIHWILDERGNAGKSWMAKYLVLNHSAVVFQNGKTGDVKYGYDGQGIVIFDLSRTMENVVNYGVMEDIKNGLFYSTKYESSMKVFPIPHVVVMANFAPSQGKFSADRLAITNLEMYNFVNRI